MSQPKNTISSVSNDVTSTSSDCIFAEAFESFPWFSQEINTNTQIQGAIQKGISLIDFLAEHYHVEKKIIRACRLLSASAAYKHHNSFSELLKLINQYPTDYLPKADALQDQQAFFKLLKPLNRLASVIGTEPSTLAKLFLTSWHTGLEKIEAKMGEKFSIEPILTMMRSSFQYGVLPILNEHDSMTKEPTNKWFSKWFGSYGLNRLLDLAKQWENISIQFSMARMNANDSEQKLCWEPLANKSVEINNHYIVELTSAYELEEEGHILEHCIGSYTQKCLLNNSLIFSIRDISGKSLSTFEAIEEDGELIISQHQACCNQEPSAFESTLAENYVATELQQVSLQALEKLTIKKQQTGIKFRKNLAKINTLDKLLEQEELQQLTQLVAFTHPKKTKKIGIYEYLKEVHPKLLKNPPKEAAETVAFLSQNRNTFTYKNKNFRINTIKDNGTILCFIHDAEKPYTCSYYGTIFIHSDNLIYRVTRKSPTNKQSTKIHKHLKKHIKQINSDYEKYLILESIKLQQSRPF